MQISMWVPYEEQRLRRTLRFVMRGQFNFYRVMGGFIVLLGLFMLTLEPTNPIGYFFVALGLLFAFAVGPLTVAWSMRMQASAIRDGSHMTLDDEWVTMIYPLVESRFRWAGLGRVIETPEVWYIMFGKLQAVTVPKELMTEEQRAVFSSFVNGLQPIGK
ncbi:YcxB family protein [Nocardia sp. IFM 10818]